MCPVDGRASAVQPQVGGASGGGRDRHASKERRRPRRRRATSVGARGRGGCSGRPRRPLPGERTAPASTAVGTRRARGRLPAPRRRRRWLAVGLAAKAVDALQTALWPETTCPESARPRGRRSKFGAGRFFRPFRTTCPLLCWRGDPSAVGRLQITCGGDWGHASHAAAPPAPATGLSLCIPATTLLSGEARLPGAPPLAERGRSHSYRRRCCPAPSLHCPHALLPPLPPAVLSLCCPSCAPVSVCGGGPHRGRPPWPPSLPSSRLCPPAPPVAPPPPPPLRRPRSVAAAGGLPHGWPPLPSGGGAPSRRRRWRCRGRPTPSRPTPPPPPFRRDAHRAARRPLGARVAHAGGHAVWGPPPVDG